MNMNEAAFLIRCSTDRQDFERQIEDLTSVADRFGYHIDESNIFGEYVTGKDDTTKQDRISIIKLRAAAERGLFDVILVAEVSRMSRDSVSGRVYVRQFCNLGIPIYFRDKMKWTMDPITKKEDESFIKELGLYFDGAAEYLKSMKTQIASGRRSLLRNNQLVVGQVPFGYRKRGGKNRTNRNELIKDEKEAIIVEDIFRSYLEEGASLKSTTLSICAKYGIRKNTASIYQILTREAYRTGRMTVFMKDPDNSDAPSEPFTLTFEPIIDKELWDAVCRKREDHRSFREGYPSQEIHLLSRLIKCPFCGYSFSPKKRSGDKPGEKYRIINGKIAYSWLCMTRISHAAGNCLSRINLNNEKLESIVWTFIKTELLDFADPKKDIRDEKIHFFQQKITEAYAQIPLFEQEIKKTEAIGNRAYQAYISAPDDVADIALKNYTDTLVRVKKMKTEYTMEIGQLKKRIKSYEGSIKYYSQTELTQDYIDSIESDENEKRKITLQLIDKITPYSIKVGVVVLELQTINGKYYILFDGYQIGEKRIAHYIASSFAVWHTEIQDKLQQYEPLSYFSVKNADIIAFPDAFDVKHVSFREMQQVCILNNWVLPYNHI